MVQPTHLAGHHAPQPLIGHDPPHRPEQAFRGGRSFFHHEATTLLFDECRVRSLMRAGIRVRDENRRETALRQLRNGRSTRAPKHKIRLGIRRLHRGQVGEHHCCDLMRRIGCPHARSIRRTCDVHDAPALPLFG